MNWLIDLLASREWQLLMLIVIAAAALIFPERSLTPATVEEREIRD